LLPTTTPPVNPEQRISSLVSYGDDDDQESKGEAVEEISPPTSATSAKRKADDPGTPLPSPSSTITTATSPALASYFFDTTATATATATTTTTTRVTSTKKQKTEPSTAQQGDKNILPDDFFDAAAANNQIIAEAEQQVPSSQDNVPKGALPTDFFDKPEEVPAQNTEAQQSSLDDEWAKFQSAIKEVKQEEVQKKVEEEMYAEQEASDEESNEESEEKDEDDDLSVEFQHKETRLLQLQELRQKKLEQLRQRHTAAATQQGKQASRATVVENDEDLSSEEDDSEGDQDIGDEYDWRGKTL